MSTSKLSTRTAATKVVAKRLVKRGINGLVCAALAGMLEGRAYAADGTWSVAAGAATHNWTDTGMWTGGTIADGAGFTANFTGIDITGAKIVSLNGTDRTIGNITFTDDTTSSHDLTISGNNLTLDVSSGAPIINVTDSARTLTISSQISGSDGLTKSGLGTLILSGNSDYTGITTVDNGTLTLGNANALGATGAGNGTVINGSNAVAFFGTTLNLGATGLTLSESFSLNGNTSGRATIYNNSSANHVLNGNIDVTSDTNHAQIRCDSTGSITVNGDISGTLANGAALFIRGDSTSLNTRILGSINMGSAVLSKNGTGTWTIGAAGKTYAWGDTSIPEGTLRMGITNVMPSATVVTFGQSSFTAATLDLNGNSQTVAGIQLAVGSSGTKTITSASAATLTVGDSNSYTYGGVLAGSLALTKTGAGILTLSNANTFTGTTTVNAGELRWGIDNALAAGNLTVNSGGTVNMNGKNDTVGTVTLNRGTILVGPASLKTGTGGFITNGGTVNNWPGIGLGGNFAYNTDSGNETTASIGSIDFNGGSRTFTIADGVQAIDVDITVSLFSATAGNRDFIKAGAGTLRISGSSFANYNLNAGTTTIQDGVLLLNKSGNNAVGGSGLITVGDGTGAAGSAILRYASTGGNDQIVNNAITINSDGLFDLNGKTETTSGALTVNAGGQVTAGGGNLSVAALTINGSVNTGNGNLTGSSLTGNGSLTLGSGLLTVNGTSSTTFSGNISGTGGLNKTGTGTLILGGSCSYSGNTVVTNGILRITGNQVLSKLTSVYLSTGAQTGTIDLAFSGTQMIKALYINGIKQPIGATFGANGTTITGTGFLSISADGTLVSFF